MTPRARNIKLIAVFILAALIPLALISMIVLRQVQATLTEEAAARLATIRRLKSRQISLLLGRFDRAVSGLQDDPITGRALDIFNDAFLLGGRQTGGTSWAAAYQEYSPYFSGLAGFYGLDDIRLISREGDVVFSVAREEDLGTNLLTGPLKDSCLAGAFSQAMSNKPAWSGFRTKTGLNIKPAAFTAGIVTGDENRIIGAAALQVPLDLITTVMAPGDGLGITGRIYLVNSDLVLLSESVDSRAEDTGRESTIETSRRRIDSAAARQALSGREGAMVTGTAPGRARILSYGPLEAAGRRWAVITEIEQAEILAPLVELKRQIIMLSGVAVALVVLLAFLMARPPVPIPGLRRGPAEPALADELEDLLTRLDQLLRKIRGGA